MEILNGSQDLEGRISTGGKVLASLIAQKGPKGDTGNTGATGPKGDKGDKGDAFTYEDFTEEQLATLKGEKGDKGDTGATGEQGPKGDMGPQGIQGETGPQGPIGATGATGPTGAKGDKGDKGDAFVYEDFTEEQLAALQGPVGPQGPKGEKGADGTGVNILGSYETLEQLKAAHSLGNIGDAYMVGANLYVWSSTTEEWLDVGNIQGPQGPQGEKGDTGATGLKGDKGDKGDKGETGPQGEIGPTGATGPQGEKGNTGVGISSVEQTSTSTEDGGNNIITVTKTDGSKSMFTVKNGSKGSTGLQGPTGEKGDTGEQGPQGEQGLQGQKGDTGPKGDNGITPTIGQNGNWYLGTEDTGMPSRGEQGEQGIQGEKGEQGEQGPRGEEGTDIIISATEPTGDNRKKVWIQNTGAERKIYVLNDNGVYEEFISKDNLDNYLTEETKIGTWIDGKPIYRKVFTFETCDNADITFEHNIADADKIWINEGASFVYINEGISREVLTLNWYHDADIWTRCWVNFFSIRFKAPFAYGVRTAYVTLEYTKTTD